MYFLGLDNGGTVSKAALYSVEGREIASVSEKTELFMPKPGFTERDMGAFWRACCRAIRGAIDKAGIKNTEIAGVATTGHGNGIYLVDDKLEPVYNGIISTDLRAGEYVKKWYGDGTFEKVLPKTMQSIWAGQPVSILAWMLDNDPETAKKIRWILMCKDYTRLRLTGEVFGDITDMSGTSFMDVGKSVYDDELLEAFGLTAFKSALPEVRGPADICGRVTAEAAAATGLVEGTPVAGGLFDINACAIATGVVDESKLCCIAGTWSINEYISREPVVHEDHCMTTRYCIPEYYLIGDSSPTSASNLEWFVNNLLGDRGGNNPYETCNEIVAKLPPEESNVLFMPFLYGSYIGPDASAAFLGLDGYHTKEHMLRAVYEGVTFATKVHIDRLARFRTLPDTARVSGGAAKSPVWMQMFADILDKRIEIAANDELGTLGAALCAGVAVGEYGSFREAVDRMVKMKHVYEPDPERSGVYSEKFGRYQKAEQALRTIWDS